MSEKAHKNKILSLRVEGVEEEAALKIITGEGSVRPDSFVRTSVEKILCPFRWENQWMLRRDKFAHE